MNKSHSNEEEDTLPTQEQWNEMDEKQKLSYIHDSLLELYLNLKIRNFEKVGHDKTTVGAKHNW